MDKPIKIVYNWIGPYGPIPNHEVPNLLNLSCVSEATQVNSTNFWADSLWHLVFCNQPGYTLGPTHYLREDDIFIYPFTLPWRINFVDYFYNNSGIFEYSHTPNSVLHNVKINRGFLLFECAAEVYVRPNQLRSMHTYLEHNNIPKNKVIYLTGCMNANELYNNFCDSNGIGQSDRMNIFSYPVLQESLAMYFNHYKPNEPEYDCERIPEKLFLSWNRRFRPHRVALVYTLNKLGLLDRSYISVGLTDPENQSVHISTQLNDYLVQRFDITSDDKNNLISKLPLVLDAETNVNQMCQDFNDATRPYYQNSLVSIITETSFDDIEVSLTEKSFKPVKEKHPWISLGASGTLQALRDMGFKTFNEFWDESYDNIKNSQDRFTRVLEVCRDIGTWDSNKIKDFRYRVKPILDHNYETLKIKYTDTLTQNIKSRIFDVIREKYQDNI